MSSMLSSISYEPPAGHEKLTPAGTPGHRVILERRFVCCGEKSMVKNHGKMLAQLMVYINSWKNHV